MYSNKRKCKAGSMITSSENATSLSFFYKAMSPQCNCEKQEYQDFHSQNSSDLQHQQDWCEC